MNLYRGLGHLIAGCLLLYNMVAIAASQTTFRFELPPIYVVDENDIPIAGAEVSMVLESWPVTGFYMKRTADNGSVTFDEQDAYYRFSSPPDGKMQVMGAGAGKGADVCSVGFTDK